jgi:hypothetical protein
MGIKTALAGITVSAGAITQAETIGSDLNGLMAEAQTRCQELTALLNFIKNDILTPASDSSNATTLGTQITALA